MPIRQYRPLSAIHAPQGATLLRTETYIRLMLTLLGAVILGYMAVLTMWIEGITLAAKLSDVKVSGALGLLALTGGAAAWLGWFKPARQATRLTRVQQCLLPA